MDSRLFFLSKSHTKTHMATDQIFPRENITPFHIEEVHIEKDIVPKMASHFESLAGKSKNSDPKVSVTKESSHANMHHGVDKQNDNKRNKAKKHDVSEKATKDGGGDKNMASMNVRKSEATPEKEGNDDSGSNKPSLEEISKARAKAQQASNEAIRAAEERYYKARESAREVGGIAKDSVFQVVQASKEYVAEKGQKGYVVAKDAMVSAGQGVKEGTKSAVGSVKGMAEYAGEKAADISHKAKEMVVGEGMDRNREEKDEIEEEQEEDDEGKMTAQKLYRMEHEKHEEKLFGGIIGAIGETIAEIAQTTRDLVLGKGDAKGHGREEEEEVYDLGYGSHRKV